MSYKYFFNKALDYQLFSHHAASGNKKKKKKKVQTENPLFESSPVLLARLFLTPALRIDPLFFFYPPRHYSNSSNFKIELATNVLPKNKNRFTLIITMSQVSRATRRVNISLPFAVRACVEVILRLRCRSAGSKFSDVWKRENHTF